MPVLNSGTPVFGLTGELDGEAIAINAGIEDWFMYTRHWNDSANVVIMEGILAQDTAESIRNAWSLKYRAQQSSGGLNADSSLVIGTHTLFSITGEKPIENLYAVKFNMTDSANISSQSWSFGDGTFSTSFSPTVIYNTDIQSQYPVQLTAMNSSSLCMTKVTHYIDFSQNDCQGTFEIYQGSSFSFQVVCQARKGDLISVNWIVDGIANGSGITRNFNNLTTGSHEICSEQIYADGCIYISCRGFMVDSFGYTSGPLCNNDFTYEIEPEMTFDPSQIGTFELAFFDASGKMFTTFFNPLPGTLDIIRSSDYEEDAFGRKTRQLEFEYSGPLQAADGQIKMATNLKGNMAIVLE